jgi:hypothetical protein
MQELYDFLRSEANKLKEEFAQASISGEGTPQEVAEFREGAFHTFIKRFFPFPHRVTKGLIRDTHGGKSASVDCVICNPAHPYLVNDQEKFQLLFAEGVDAAIEVKPDIGRSAQLIEGLDQGLTVKALRRHNLPTNFRMPWVEEHARRVPFIIFAMRCKADPRDTGREILTFYRDRQTAPVDQADFVVVQNVGVFANFIDPSMCQWKGLHPSIDRKGWFFEGWGPDTLAGFLWHLNACAFASIPIIEHVLPPYLISKGGITVIEKISI